MVFADSLTPVSRDNYRFSDHPDYLAAYRASIAKIAKSPCEILLTPHPSASAMKERLTGKQPLFDPDGCKNYAAKVTQMLDERLAKEAAAKGAGGSRFAAREPKRKRSPNPPTCLHLPTSRR